MTDRDLAGCGLSELIDRYWNLAYAEGTGGRTTDTENGDAMECRSAIDREIRELSRAPSRDAERLDWLAHHGVSIRQDYREEWSLLGAYHMKNPVVDDRKRFGSAREAIDAAIAASGEEGN